MPAIQLFRDDFESLWREFDERLKSELLRNYRELGSFYRLSLHDPDVQRELGRRFYESLEASFQQDDWFTRLGEVLVEPMPTTFDEVVETARQSNVGPLHQFFYLLLHIREHPFRAFFSGRDQPLMFNTLSVRIHQSLEDSSPQAVSYGLSLVNLEHCPGNSLTQWRAKDEKDEKKGDDHPQNHFGYIDPFDPVPPGVPIWYWHF